MNGVMPRRRRGSTGSYVYHVLNRAVGRATLFGKDADYLAFENILREALAWQPMRVLAYCVMPNHWHLVLWPRRDGELSEYMRWLSVTHTQRWHAHHKTAGTGPVYQGRFKSFPIQEDEHFLTVCRYVERNALRAKRVERAESWRWSSLWQREHGDARWLSEWPVPRPRRWVSYVNGPETAAEVAALRRSVQRGSPYGVESWQHVTAAALGIEASLRPRDRPRKEAES